MGLIVLFPEFSSLLSRGGSSIIYQGSRKGGGGVKFSIVFELIHFLLSISTHYRTRIELVRGIKGLETRL